MTTEQFEAMVAQLQPEKVEKFIATVLKDEAQMECLKGKTQEEMIKLYIECVAKRDNKINDAYYHNPLGKTIKDCYEYLEKQVQKLAHGSRSMMISSTAVFEIVENYFLDNEIPKYENKAKPVTSTTAKPQNNKEKAEQWEIDHNNRINNWEIHHNAEVDKWNQEHQHELFFDPLDNPHLKDICPYLNEKNPYLTEEDSTNDGEKENV